VNGRGFIFTGQYFERAAKVHLIPAADVEIQKQQAKGEGQDVFDA